jgi:hypothetical protein
VDLEKGIPARHPLQKVRQVVNGALTRLRECPSGGNPAQCRSVRRETPASPHGTPLRDGAGRHGANALVVPDTLSLLTLPPGSIDQNQVETIWQYLRANRLVLSVFDSCDAIVDACRAAWNLRQRSQQRHLNHVAPGHRSGERAFGINGLRRFWGALFHRSRMAS